MGLLNPITLRAEDSRYILVAGYHRLEACRSLGWDTIPATLQHFDILKAELAEVDENLRRSELTALEQGEYLLRRDKVLVAMGLKAPNHRPKKADKLSGFLTGVEIASELGLNERTARRRKQIASGLTEDVKETIRTSKLANKKTELLKLARIDEDDQQAIVEKIVSGEAKNIKQAKKVIKEERKVAVPWTEMELPERCRLLCGDFEEIAQALDDGSFDAIITDPPYPRKFLPLYRTLAKEAKRLLKVGGSLLVMVGQSYLPEVFALMVPHIRYQWTVAYLTPGGQSAQLWQRKVNTFWKPVLWFVNGEYEGDWLGDVAQSAANDKRFHQWGQSESGMADLIERFTYPGDRILDPFCGGGTTGVVALAMDRLFVGVDNDTTAVQKAKARIGEGSQAGT